MFSLLCRLHVIYPASEEEGFDFHYQAKMQLAGLAVTLALSIVGGLFTGAILKIPFFDKTRTQSLFDDEDYWIVSESKTKYFYRKAFQFCLYLVLKYLSTQYRFSVVGFYFFSFFFVSQKESNK